MAEGTVTTVWKLVLSDKEVREGENAIQRIARLLKDKLGTDGAKAIDKTTEAIKEQTEALKKNEEAAKKAADAKAAGLGDVTGTLGGGLGGVSRFAGVGGAFSSSAGEGLGLIGDIGDAVEGLGELGSTLGQLGPAGALAGVAIVALGLVISDFAKAAQKQADELNRAIDTMREVADEIAGGATSDDIQESIDQLQFRRDLETEILAESTAAYEEFVQGIRDAFGIFAPLVEGILKVVDPREEALKTQIEESNKLISDSEAKERAYNKALEKGLTSKADAKQAEEERQKSVETAAREQERAQKDQQREQEKATADADRAQQQAQQKAEQAAAKRLATEQKYTDTLVDIARKGRDDAAAALKSLNQTVTDNQSSFWEDIAGMSRDFQDSEREEAIQRAEEELRDMETHTRDLERIRDDAFKSEEDALRQRDFLSATKIREQANNEIEQENEVFKDTQAEKMRARQQEDAQQLRELDKGRRERLHALNQANDQARLAYRRDLENQRDAQKIAAREAAIARNREIQNASETARALLGVHMQSSRAQLDLASSTLNQLRGIGGVTNNTSNRTVHGGVHVPINVPAGSMSGTAIRSQVLSVLGSVGLA